MLTISLGLLFCDPTKCSFEEVLFNSCTGNLSWLEGGTWLVGEV